MGRIFGTTTPGPAHGNEHKCFIRSFPEIYRGAAWHLGTATVLVDQAGRNTLLARSWEKTPRRKVLTNPAVTLQQWDVIVINIDKVRRPSFIHRLATLTLQLQMGEVLGQKKEEEEGRGREVALPESHLWFCRDSNSCCPGSSSCTLGRASHHSCLFPLQVGLKGSTYWDSRRQSKAIIQFHAKVKACPLQQTWMTFPLNQHLDLCLWQATIFSYFFFCLTMIQNRVGQA